MTNGFHLYMFVVIKMVGLQDDYNHNEAMLNIINAGTQYGPNQNEADHEFNAYLANLAVEQQPHVQEPPVQESAGEVYLLIVYLHLIYMKLNNSISSYIYINVLLNLLCL
jgi:hypothetical protein